MDEAKERERVEVKDGQWADKRGHSWVCQSAVMSDCMLQRRFGE